MRRLYSLLVYCAIPFAFTALLWRGMRDRSYWQGLGERFGWGARYGSRRGSPSTLWLHAVSLGEMSAAAPLVRALRCKYPQWPMVLTTATPTGRARAQALFGDVRGAGAAGGAVCVDVRFLPYDTPGAVARFLDDVNPRLAVIMETELWPNLFNECARRHLPVMLASARLSAKSVSRYRRLGRLFRGVFAANVSVAAQTRVDAERFVAIGATASQTHVIGNIKFDLELSAEVLDQGQRLRARLKNMRAVWIAGSTHAGEEESVLDAHETLRQARPDALLLLAPRHPARFQAVAELLTRRGVRFVRRSDSRDDGRNRHDGSGGDALVAAAVMLVDSIGELAMLYATADVAFVGGSLVPVGGHNLLEPAALGIPVLTGPYHANAKDIAALLLREGGALQVNDAAELAAVLLRLFADAAQCRRIGAIGRGIVEANRGSVDRLLGLIEPLLLDPAPAVAASPSTAR